MTFEEKLAFEVSKELLDIHNEELNKAKKEFFKVFQRVWDEGIGKGIKMFDLEDALNAYLDIIKIEYYKAGKRVDHIVQNETLRNEVEKSMA